MTNYPIVTNSALEGGMLIRETKCNTGRHSIEQLKEKIISETHGRNEYSADEIKREHISNSETTQKGPSMPSSKSFGFRRQNTGNGDYIGSDLKDPVV